MKHPRSIKRNLGAALNGIRVAIREEISFKVLVCASTLSAIAMSILSLSRTEKAVVWVMIFSVLVLELINAVVERMLDLLYPDYNVHVGIIKDLMAGIVLVAGLGSLIIAWLIFAPKIPFLQDFI